MHAVAPIVARDGRDVDALPVGHLQAQPSVHRQPVLQGQDREHRRRREVHADDAAANPRFAEPRRVALAVQHLVVETVRDAAVLLPPGPQRVHVVGRGGADAQVGVVRRIGERLGE